MRVDIFAKRCLGLARPFVKKLIIKCGQQYGGGGSDRLFISGYYCNENALLVQPCICVLYRGYSASLYLLYLNNSFSNVHRIENRFATLESAFSSTYDCPMNDFPTYIHGTCGVVLQKLQRDAFLPQQGYSATTPYRQGKQFTSYVDTVSCSLRNLP